jgi:integrase
MFKVLFGTITKRTRSYDAAFRFLTGLRFKTDERTFDERDYRRDNPLGFTNLSRKYLQYRQGEVRPGSYRNIRRHIQIAQEFFKQMNVKDIRYGHLEDLLQSIELSDKSKHNILSTIHAFFVWLHRRQEIKEMPIFPTVSYELGRRMTVSKDRQMKILEEVKRIAPLKVWLGIKLLCTYISIRPGELIKLKEGDIDIENGYLYFPHPKEKRFKSVPILPDDIEALSSFPRSLPSVSFFRHGGGISGVAEGESYGLKYFYKWWVKACANLDIAGVDLYGGTRHSSARAARAYRTPEEIKRAMMTRTNKAFERYFDIEDQDVRDIYRDVGTVIRPDWPLTGKNKP